MNQPRVLVVTGGHLCRNPRVVKEADTLARAGYAVTVLGVRNHRPSEVFDEQIRRDSEFRHLAIDDLDSPGARLRRLQMSLARRLARRIGWQSPLAFGPAGALLKQAANLSAELTIVHTKGPMWAGWKLLGQGRRVAVDFEDWHAEDLLPADRAIRPQRLLVEMEGELMQRAAYTSTTSQALAEALQARYGGPLPVVVTNSFPLQPHPRSGPPGEPPRLFWFSQTIGPGRGLEEFVVAWASTQQPSRLVLLGEPRRGYKDTLLGLLPPERRSLVEFRPLVPAAELPAVIAQHDIGLALEVTTILNRDLTITNKILQYLDAGLAVVASNTTGQREVIGNTSEAGIIVNTGDSIAFAHELDRLLANRKMLAVRQQAARRLAETRFCWEQEVPKLLARVSQAIAGPRP